MTSDIGLDEFAIDARTIDPTTVLVTIVGDLDMETVPRATDFLVRATETRPEHLILDLSGVEFMSSTGISLLLAARSSDPRIHGDLHLIGVTGNHGVERPLAHIALLDRFDTAPDLETLLRSLDIADPDPEGATAG